MGAKSFYRLLVVLGALSILYVAYRVTLMRMVETRLDEIRNRHEPTTLIELGTGLVHPATEDNATLLYLQAFTKYSKFTFAEDDPRGKLLPVVGFAKLPPRGGNLPGEMHTAIAQYLAENMEALKLLHAGANRSQCRYPVEYSKGIATLPKHFAAARQGTRLLLLESLLQADAGNMAGAIESLKTGAALAKSVGSDPTLIAHLERIACQMLTDYGLERVLSRGQLTDTQLADLETIWAGLAEPNAIVPVMSGERCFGVTACETLRKLPLKDRGQIGWFVGNGTGGSYAVYYLYRIGGLADLDLIDYLPILNGYIQACRLPLEQRPAAAKSVCVTTTPSKLYLMSRGLAGALDNAIIKDVRHLTQLQAAITALRVERYRLSHGELPIDLSAIAGPITTDPFSNQPLRYMKLPKGYVVYSVGEDGKNDDGDENEDITFVVER